jgi:hypothetical protein
VRITREVAYVEVVDAEIIANNDVEAHDIAVAIGEGVQVEWPHLHRYNTSEREAVDTRFIGLEFVEEKNMEDVPGG